MRFSRNKVSSNKKKNHGRETLKEQASLPSRQTAEANRTLVKEEKPHSHRR